jgi:3-oxoacyl-[acyl-carrier-protein] synthase-1
MKLDVIHWGAKWGAAPVICATAAWNGLAFNPYQTWACRRAELTAFAETPFRCINGQRATMAQIRTLPPRSHGLQRMQRIAGRLVDELLPKLATLPTSSRLAVVLCLSERFDRSSSSKNFSQQRSALETTLADRFKQQGFSPLMQTQARGHASLAFALIEAGSALASGAVEAALVGGIETYYDPEVVEELLEQERLFDGENLDSFIPGEGGAFFLLARPDVARRFHWEQVARVEAAATDQEPASMFSQAPCQGLGLSRAMGAIADRARDEKRLIDWWLSDLTNESYRVHEWQLALPRASAGVCGERSRMEFLPVLLGDLGAATMPTAVAIAVEGFLRRDPDAKTCLVAGSSTGQDRGALLLARIE